jgi:hypothetical protein
VQKVALFVSVWEGSVGSMFDSMLKRTMMMIHADDMANHLVGVRVESERGSRWELQP